NPDPPCPGETPGHVAEGALVSDVADEDAAGTFELEFEAKEASPPCDPPPPPCRGCGSAFAWGDPHLGTLDGVRFDAQVMGEYRYLGPDPLVAGADGPRIHAQHGLWGSRATIMDGVAFEHDGRRVEVYSADAEGGAGVVIDGEE